MRRLIGCALAFGVWLAPVVALAACPPSAPPASWSSKGPARPVETHRRVEAVSALTLVLLRHAEKPLKPDGIMVENGNLGEVGVSRANRLVERLPQMFGCPDLIVAADSSGKSDNKITGQYFSYVRPVATIAPFAASAGQPIWTPYGHKDYEALAADLLGDAAFAPKPDGTPKTVFVVWEHKRIPKLFHRLIDEGKLSLLEGRSITVDGKTFRCEAPTEWPQCDFDSVWLAHIRAGEVCLTKMQEGLDTSAFTAACKGAESDGKN